MSLQSGQSMCLPQHFYNIKLCEGLADMWFLLMTMLLAVSALAGISAICIIWNLDILFLSDGLKCYTLAYIYILLIYILIVYRSDLSMYHCTIFSIFIIPIYSPCEGLADM